MAQLSTTMSHAQRATAFHYSSISLPFSTSDSRQLSHLLDLEALLPITITRRCLCDLGFWSRIGHFDVSHVADLFPKTVVVYALMWSSKHEGDDGA